MQSTKLDVALSSKEMGNIIQNDTWNRVGVSRLISYYPVLINVTRCVSSLISRLLSTLSKHFDLIFSRKILCSFVSKN